MVIMCALQALCSQESHGNHDSIDKLYEKEQYKEAFDAIRHRTGEMARSAR